MSSPRGNWGDAEARVQQLVEPSGRSGGRFPDRDIAARKRDQFRTAFPSELPCLVVGIGRHSYGGSIRKRNCKRSVFHRLGAIDVQSNQTKNRSQIRGARIRMKLPHPAHGIGEGKPGIDLNRKIGSLDRGERDL